MWRCARCGKDITYVQSSIQHRKARSMGGTNDPSINSPANLIVLCGSGTTGCHGHVEVNRREARKYVDPHDVPVQYKDGLFLLDDAGHRIPTK